MSGTNCTIDAVAKLQKYLEKLPDLRQIMRIKIEMSEAAFKDEGLKSARPFSALGAQMSCAYIAAVQLINGQVLPLES